MTVVVLCRDILFAKEAFSTLMAYLIDKIFLGKISGESDVTFDTKYLIAKVKYAEFIFTDYHYDKMYSSIGVDLMLDENTFYISMQTLVGTIIGEDDNA